MLRREKVICNGEVRLSFDDTEEVRRAIAERIYAFVAEHECWSGEQLQQSDSPLIEAPSLISDILDDVIKFEVEYLD